MGLFVFIPSNTILNYSEKLELLNKLHAPRVYLGIKKDFSLSLEIFGHELLIRGLFIWGRALTEDSRKLSTMDCDVILYNETDIQKVSPPPGFLLFRIRDLQEFPYVAAVRIRADE
ncbi:MAG: hypothetical protein C4527_22950 [Candidatus Omnitrophota bacterium]|nr:MAG: hypothetical protein C4527_22950 [Candidatus Omnitrophota bacterium]